MRKLTLVTWQNLASALFWFDSKEAERHFIVWELTLLLYQYERIFSSLENSLSTRIQLASHYITEVKKESYETDTLPTILPNTCIKKEISDVLCVTVFTNSRQSLESLLKFFRILWHTIKLFFVRVFWSSLNNQESK